MRTKTPRIGVEIVVMGLVVASLAGALALVARAYRRPSMPPRAPAVVVAAPIVTAPEPPAVAPEPEPPAPTPVDLTPGKLAEIAAREDEDRAAAEKASRVASEREAAIAAALANAERWRRREGLVRDKLDALESQARRAEDDVDALARERDILAEKAEDLRTKVSKAKLHARDGVAVLPYKGPNGTWRRPIAIECSAGSAQLQPGGTRFSTRELVSFGSTRLHPLVQEVAKAMVRSRGVATPDGAASVPYILFVIRPEGISSYYMARALLDPLGIVQGYELADADWDIEFPDLNDPAEWRGLSTQKPAASWPPPEVDREIAPRPGLGGFASRGESDKPTGGTGRGRDGRPAGVDPIPRSETGWGRDGEDRPGDGADAGDGMTVGRLDALARGESGGRPVPNDGRVEILPGIGEEDLPSFQPTPPSGDDTPSGGTHGGRGPKMSPGGAPLFDPPGMGTAASPNLGMGNGFPNPPVRPSMPIAGSGSGSSTVKPSPSEATSLGNLLGDGPVNPGATPGAGTGGNLRGTSSGPSRSNPGRGTAAATAGSSPGVSVGLGRDSTATPGGDTAPNAGTAATDEAVGGISDDASGAASGTQGPRDPTAVAGLSSPSTTVGSRAAVAADPLDSITDKELSTGLTAPPSGGSSGATPPGQGRGSSSNVAPAGSPPQGMAGSASQAASGSPRKMPGGAVGSSSGLLSLGSAGQSSSSYPSGSPNGGAGGASGESKGNPGGGSRPDDAYHSRSVDMTVLCGPGGVTIGTTGESVDWKTLSSRDDALTGKLAAIVRARQQAEPGVGLRPKVKFVVQPGGEKVYLKARWQAVAAGTGWPMTLQMTGASPARPFRAEVR